MAGVLLGALDFVEDWEELGLLLAAALPVASAGVELPIRQLAESKALVVFCVEGDKKLVELLRELALSEA